ncbi:MAG: DinB family protein [Acidobacteria bacterium]|nr:DinB family protein [Acidobacteriota bacterium]
MNESTQAFFPLHPQIHEIRTELGAVSSRWHRFVAGLTDEQWAMQPAPKSWSPAECLIHLNISSEKFMPILTEALQKAQTTGPAGVGPMRRDIAGWMLCKMLEPPYRIKVKTPQPFMPERVEARETVLKHFDELQGRLTMLMDMTKGLAVDKIKISSPFEAKLKYSIFSAFKVIPAHQRRHLWQAEKTLKK